MSDIETNELKAPPHSIEAEQSVIGALLSDNRAFDVIGGMLTPAHFYRSDHRVVYEHIERMIVSGREVDPMTLFESLTVAGHAERSGGLPYILQIALHTPGAANVRRYAEIVLDRAKRRNVILVADDLAQAAFNSRGVDAGTIIDQAAEKLEKLQTEGTQSSGPIWVGDDLVEVVTTIDEQYHGSAPPAESTGFIDLDAKLNGGFRGGELIIIAGRPSMGKTALAMCIADTVAQSKPVSFHELEMAAKQLHLRNIARIGGIPLPRVLNGKHMHEEDWPRLTYAVQTLRERNLHIDDKAGATLADIRNGSRKVKRTQGGLGLIVVDYLQLMEGGNTENRTQQIGSFSRGLKTLAKQLDVPIIALAQLSREVEKRPNKRPMMSDLRDSGEIEQDADVILFIYRDEVYNPDSMDKGIAEIIVGKQRNGETGRVGLVYAGQFLRFDNMAPGASYGRQVQTSRKREGFD